MVMKKFYSFIAFSMSILLAACGGSSGGGGGSSSPFSGLERSAGQPVDFTGPDAHVEVAKRYAIAYYVAEDLMSALDHLEGEAHTAIQALRDGDTPCISGSASLSDTGPDPVNDDPFGSDVHYQIASVAFSNCVLLDEDDENERVSGFLSHGDADPAARRFLALGLSPGQSLEYRNEGSFQDESWRDLEMSYSRIFRDEGSERRERGFVRERRLLQDFWQGDLDWRFRGVLNVAGLAGQPHYELEFDDDDVVLFKANIGVDADEWDWGDTFRCPAPGSFDISLDHSGIVISSQGVDAHVQRLTGDAFRVILGGVEEDFELDSGPLFDIDWDCL